MKSLLGKISLLGNSAVQWGGEHCIRDCVEWSHHSENVLHHQARSFLTRIGSDPMRGVEGLLRRPAKDTSPVTLVQQLLCRSPRKVSFA